MLTRDEAIQILDRICSFTSIDFEHPQLQHVLEYLKQSPAEQGRKVVSITSHVIGHEHIFTEVLCDDGTVWEKSRDLYDHSPWKKLPPIPQGDDNV